MLSVSRNKSVPRTPEDPSAVEPGVEPGVEKERGKVIITYGRSLISLIAAHSLGKRGIEVIGCDDVGMTVLSFSRFVKKTFVHAPAWSKPEKFIDDLEKQIIKHKPKDDRPYVLIPVFNETKLIAQYKERLEQHITVACPDFAEIDRIDPKDNLARTAKELNVNIPGTWLPENKDQLEGMIAGEIGFPCFIKPPNEVGGRGVQRLHNADELRAAYTEVAKRYDGLPLVQEAVEGDDYCLSVLFQDGELKASMAYRNLKKWPKESGAGVVRETVDDTRFARVAADILGPIGWNGVAEIDFLWSGREDENPYLIEINPRFWAGLDHSVQSAVDFPWLLYELAAKGEIPEIARGTVGQRSKVPVLWFMAALNEAVSGAENFSALQKAWPEIIKSIKNRRIREGMKLLGQSLGKTLSFRDAYQDFRKMYQEGQEAQTTPYAQHDPMVGLGVLFIVASLIRHGELPHEVRR